MRTRTTLAGTALASVALILIAFAATVVTAQDKAKSEAASVFESLYGDKLREVKKSPSKTDDVEMAAALLDGAQVASDQKELLALLCKTAYDLASRSPDGLSHAISAMKLLAEQVPEKRTEAEGKILLLYEKQYKIAKGKDERQIAGESYLELLLETAESAQDRLEYTAAVSYYSKARIVATRIKSDRLAQIKNSQAAAVSLVSTYQTLKQLLIRLESNPKDEISAKRLIELYIARLDQPEEALAYRSLISDPTLKTNLEMFALPIEDLTETQALTMAKWYNGYTAKATEQAKVSILTRVKAYYEQYLALHEAKDILRTAAELTIAKIDSQLAKFSGNTATSKTKKADKSAKIEWTDLKDEIAQVIADKSYVRRGADVQFKEGTVRIQGVDKGGAYIVVPLDIKNMVFSAKIKKLRGTSVMIGARLNEDGHYSVSLNPENNIVLSRWDEPTSTGKELTRGQFADAYAKDGALIQLAVIDEIIIVFVNGKRVMYAKDPDIFENGGIIFGGSGADIEFSELKYMEPTEEQIKQLTGPQPKR